MGCPRMLPSCGVRLLRVLELVPSPHGADGCGAYVENRLTNMNSRARVSRDVTKIVLSSVSARSARRITRTHSGSQDYFNNLKVTL